MTAASAESRNAGTEHRTAIRHEPELNVLVLQDGEMAVAEVVGALDPVSADHLAEDLVALVHLGTRQLAVDLSGARARDTSVLSPLAHAHAALRATSGHLYVIVDDDETLHRLHGSGFDRIALVFLTRRYRDRLVHEYGKYLMPRTSPERLPSRTSPERPG